MDEQKTGVISRLLRSPAPPATPEEYFAHLPTLATPRLILRRLTMRDAADVYEYARDREVARQVLWEAHASVWESKAFLRFIIRQYRTGQPASWGIVLKETGRVIGTIGFMSWNADNSTMELGYSLARAYWNQGLMTEALTAVLRQTFDVLKINRAEAMHFTDNPASGRVMAKCGMQYEGRLRQRIRCRGAFRDVDMWAMLRSDWKKRTARKP